MNKKAIAEEESLAPCTAELTAQWVHRLRDGYKQSSDGDLRSAMKHLAAALKEIQNHSEIETHYWSYLTRRYSAIQSLLSLC